MSKVIQIVDRGDPCTLFAVVALLLAVGAYLASPLQQKWGGVLAGTAFVAYGIYEFLTSSPSSADELFALAVRCLAVAGLVLGAAWIVLPLLATLGRVTSFVFLETPRRWAEEARRRASEREERRRERERRRREDEATARA